MRHHYVPRDYLAPFTRERTAKSGRVWVFGRDPASPPRRALLADVAYENHMYSVPDARGAPSPALERRLARQIEAPFLAWHRGVVRQPRGHAAALVARMTRADRVAVARYVAYQHLRTPAQRLLDGVLGELAHRQHFRDRAVRAACEAAWHRFSPKARLPLTRAERRIELDAWHAGLEALTRRWRDDRPQLWLRPMDRYADSLLPTLVDAFAWRVVELPDEVAHATPLVTCDHPLVLVRPRPQAGGDTAGLSARPGWDVDLGGGWSEPGLEMTLALSPRHALLLVRDPGALALGDDPARFAESVRVRTARYALRHVYARDDDPAVATLLAGTPAPSVYLEVGGELLPGTAGVAEVIRRLDHRGTTTFGVRYTA